MIKHHPKFELLKSFVEGDLPASLAAGVAIHADFCSICQQHIDLLTEQVAEMSFEQQATDKLFIDDQRQSYPPASAHLDDMIAQITASDALASTQRTAAPVTMSFKGTQYQLPNALRNMSLGKIAQIGKLSRARVQLDEGKIHTSLLHIAAGGSIPEHTHKGFELTLLLAGSFADAAGEYVPGDFIMLDQRHQHQPATEAGCLCYTVVNDALHFTQGINKMLNPIGSFIY
ncbi:anti-ECFsigma factor, ChrR [Colwellia chukchiensis]|uniref:Anti-ECFsigma factor, ChrR n=1 Tax=Colwellia chukchiensis TaxID=641665 RepID=A0A1H7SVE8_9GAMM|nr:ChrR family anti-sigma-E factor [Colwellia chukchiensis]SEL76551.1 anti-ECFsigma factor, ChrR [Colwellia chukchiensis]